MYCFHHYVSFLHFLYLSPVERLTLLYNIHPDWLETRYRNGSETGVAHLAILTKWHGRSYLRLLKCYGPNFKRLWLKLPTLLHAFLYFRQSDERIEFIARVFNLPLFLDVFEFHQYHTRICHGFWQLPLEVMQSLTNVKKVLFKKKNRSFI